MPAEAQHTCAICKAGEFIAVAQRRMWLGTKCLLLHHDMKPEMPKTLVSTLDARPQETDRELILRFFAMAGHMADYQMPLSSFLNDEADRGIRLDAAALRQRAELFKKALHNVGQLPPASPTNTVMHPLLRQSMQTGGAGC